MFVCFFSFSFLVHLFRNQFDGAESLKLQRNLDNYNYLKNSRSDMPGPHTDKEDFQVTKVSLPCLVSDVFVLWNMCQ